MDKFVDFTPNVPIQYEGTKAYQIVDGKKRVLYPPDVLEILALQKDGMPDEDIAAWMKMV